MTRRTVTNAGIDYVIADDDRAAGDTLWWAVLRTRAIDELTNLPPAARIGISTTTPGCLPRAGDDGVCGLVARPRDVSSAMVTPGALTAQISADGFLPRSLSAEIDAARRRLTGAASPGDVALNVAPPDPALVPVPFDAGSRRQFRPGRGVLLERPVNDAPDDFTLVDDVVTPPSAGEVPIVDRVAVLRLPFWRVAGVPIVLPDQPLHRAQPARLRGIALRQPGPGSAPIPAPLARIGIAGAWWTFPEILGNSNPPHATNFVSIAAPFAFDHATAVAVEICTLMPDAIARFVAAPAARGALELSLRSWTGLHVAGGDVLQIEQSNSGERELVVTDAFSPPPLASLPARVPLRTPLAFRHLPGAAVALVPVPSIGAAGVTAAPLGQLLREAQHGDCVAFVSSLAAAPTGAVLRIEAGTAREELRFVTRLPTHAGGVYSHQVPIAADGTFEFPPIGRVAQIRIEAEHAGQAPLQPIDFAPDYRSDNTLQILFMH